MLRIGICDDDRNTREKLHEVISQTLFQYTDMEFVYYEDGEEVIDALKMNDFNIDLLFLDIHMRRTDGMKTADIIRKQAIDVDIIFMTISGDKVFEGYKYKAFAYCLKPVESSTVQEVLIQYIEEKNESSDCINIAINGKRIRIPLNKIRYFESQKRKVTVHTLTDDYTFYAKLDEIEEVLSSEKFFRCHQSYIVNRDMIDSMTRTEITMGKDTIPMSRRYYGLNRG